MNINPPINDRRATPRYGKTFTGIPVGADAVQAVQKPAATEFQPYTKHGDIDRNKVGKIIDLFA